MVKDILNSINGLGLWGTMAIILFFLVFAWWLFSTIMMDDKFVERMGSLPIDSNDKKEL